MIAAGASCLLTASGQYQPIVEPQASPSMRTLRRLTQNLGLATGTTVNGSHQASGPPQDREEPEKGQRCLAEVCGYDLLAGCGCIRRPVWAERLLPGG